MANGGAERGSTGPAQRVGRRRTRWLPVVLLSLWLITEIARPSYPLKIPLVCSLALAGYWLSMPVKRWDPVILFALGFVVVGWLGVPFAVNQYAAFWACYGMTVIVCAVSIPAAHVLRSVSQFHLYVGSFLAATAYVGVFAIGHGGYGPAGAWGGQDENYVAAMMSAALPFAYFGFSATRKISLRLLFILLLAITIAATVIGLSRGGFLGIALGGFFCFLYSPRKLAATATAIVGILALVVVAPASYWDEVRSITDTKEGTADHRLELWKIATREYLDNPVLGVAPGNFRWRIGEYQTEEQIEHFGRSMAGAAIVHSTYFEVLSETGTVGSVCFLGMVGLTFRDLRRVSKRCDRVLRKGARRLHPAARQSLEWARAYALSFQGGLLGFLVCSAFLSTTYLSTIWVMCAASVALRYILVNELVLATEPQLSPLTPRNAEAPWATVEEDDARTSATPARLSELLRDRGRP